MEDSVFTRIVKREIPSHKVYEDEMTMAFMDIHPIVPGMIVVVPKVQVANFEDLEDADYLALWTTVKKVARKIREVFPDCLKVAVQVEGLDTPDHAHAVLFPLHLDKDLEGKVDIKAEPDHDELTKMAERLKING